MADLIPLPAEGPRRLIFIRALRAYSDQCENPELTPGCPFYEMAESGPTCGEECRELLGQYGSEAAPSREVIFDLGEGYAVTRRPLPRPRRPPATSIRPFDVFVIRRSDEARPRDERRTTSLIEELREFIVIPPWLHANADERAYVIRACKEELAKRGVDVEGLIRYGIAPLIAGMVGMQLRFGGASMPEPDPTWIRLLEESTRAIASDTDPDSMLANSVAGPFRQRVQWWAAVASLEEIEAWRAPDRWPTRPPAIDPRRHDDALWVLDRFTQTYFENWSRTSLRLEWRYQYAQRPGPCSKTWMADRPIHVKALAKELAERDASTLDEEESGATPAAIRVEDFTSVAVEQIEAGNSEIAAGIFEGCTRLEPLSPTARNNYGFCLLPTDPARGYEALLEAEKMGFEPRITNIANQVVVLLRLERESEARELARAALDAGHPHTTAYLWAENANGVLRLVPHDDVHAYLRDLLKELDKE